MAIWNEPKSNYVASDEVKPSIFNELAENEKYLKATVDTKITTAQVKDAVMSNTQASSRVNLVVNEVLSTSLGKVRKWFADLKALAFLATVGDAQITDVAASKVTGLHAVATSGSYNNLINLPTLGTLAPKNSITESDISGNVSGSKISGQVASSANADNAARSTKLSQTDSRSVNDTPSTYMSSGAGQVLDFKTNTVIGLSVTDIYSQVWTIIPWADASGGYPVQIAHNSKGMYKRYGTSATVWSAWERLSGANDLGVAGGIATLDASGKLLTAQKPTYTKSDVGLSTVDNIRQYSSSNPPPYPVSSVNGKTGVVTLTGLIAFYTDRSTFTGYADSAFEFDYINPVRSFVEYNDFCVYGGFECRPSDTITSSSSYRQLGVMNSSVPAPVNPVYTRAFVRTGRAGAITSTVTIEIIIDIDRVIYYKNGSSITSTQYFGFSFMYPRLNTDIVPAGWIPQA